MSDLISRSAVIKALEECNLDKQLFEKDVFEKINAIPIAYDVEKVVAELEEMANHYHKCCLVDYNEGAEVGVRESMAIVRKGVVE